MAFNRPIELVDPRTPGLPSINARRPNQNFQRFVPGVKSIGNSNYNGLQTKLERRMAAGLTLLTAYTWAKSMSGPARSGRLDRQRILHRHSAGLLQSPNEHSLSGFDVTQRFVQTVLYELPLVWIQRMGASHWKRVEIRNDYHCPKRISRPESSMAAIQPGPVSNRAPTSCWVKNRTCRRMSEHGSAGSTRAHSRSRNGVHSARPCGPEPSGCRVL